MRFWRHEFVSYLRRVKWICRTSPFIGSYDTKPSHRLKNYPRRNKQLGVQFRLSLWIDKASITSLLRMEFCAWYSHENRRNATSSPFYALSRSRMLEYASKRSVGRLSRVFKAPCGSSSARISSTWHLTNRVLEINVSKVRRKCTLYPLFHKGFVRHCLKVLIMLPVLIRSPSDVISDIWIIWLNLKGRGKRGDNLRGHWDEDASYKVFEPGFLGIFSNRREMKRAWWMN